MNAPKQNSRSKNASSASSTLIASLKAPSDLVVKEVVVRIMEKSQPALGRTAFLGLIVSLH